MSELMPALSSLNNGQYQVLSVLGAGGFGITYLCMDRKTDHLCAIKEYMPDHIATRESRTKDILPDPERSREYLHGKKRFCEEAELLSKMQKLPGIVHIRDMFEEHNTAYYVMDYIEGKTLKQLTAENGGRLPVSDALSYIVQAAYAMERVHVRIGIFHRDLSPENIMVMGDGSVKIIDFGSAKALTFDDNQVYSIVLKPGFAPPEQYSAMMQQGSFTDVYALAGTLYFIMTGQKLPSAPARIAGERYLPAGQLVSCPEHISRALDRALRLNPKERTQTMKEFINDLLNNPSNGPVSAAEDTSREETLPGIWLLIESGRSAGQLIALEKDRWIGIGRNPGRCQVVIPGQREISGLHFFARYDSGKNLFYIIDRSTNGTYYKGRRLGKDKCYEIAAGSRLLVGSRNCTIVLGENSHAK